MRQIVYDNIMELIKHNRSTVEQTQNGTRYVLHGTYGSPILCLYQDNRKIKLFVNEKLFASDSLRKPAWPFDTTYEHRQQLYQIRRALEGQTTKYQIARNFSAKSRARCGATPKQTDELQCAWFKSRKIDYAMCGNVGNSR